MVMVRATYREALAVYYVSHDEAQGIIELSWKMDDV